MHRRCLDLDLTRRPIWVGLVVIAFVVLAATVQASLLFGPEGMTPNATALIRCEPSVVEGPADALLSVDIYVQDVVNLYGADVQLTFDINAAQVEDADPATSGVQIQPLSTFLKPDFVLFKTADNNTGTIHYALTQLNPSEPATGSGPLARVQFRPLRAGTFSMPFTYNMLSDRNGVEIPSVTQECTVIFTDGVSSPSPTVTLTPTEVATSTPTASATPDPTATPTDTVTPIDTITSTPTVSSTPVPSRTATPTPTTSATPAPSSTATATSTPTTSTTPVPSSTATPTATPTETPTATLEETPALTETPSASPTPTVTASPTPYRLWLPVIFGRNTVQSQGVSWVDFGRNISRGQNSSK